MSELAAFLDEIEGEIRTLTVRHGQLSDEMKILDREIQDRLATKRLIQRKLGGSTAMPRLLAAAPAPGAPAKKVTQRDAIFQLLEHGYPDGLSAGDTTSRLYDMGFSTITINTVSSLLSRARKDGEVSYDQGKFYRAPPVAGDDARPKHPQDESSTTDTSADEAAVSAAASDHPLLKGCTYDTAA